MALLGSLVWAGGLWNLLANTRILSLLTRAGVIAFTDADQGFYKGVPDAEHFVASQDPLEWPILALVVVLLLGVWAIRALRFEMTGRFAGVEALPRTGIRAYFYGLSAGAFRPFGYGDAAAAAVLQERGAGPGSAVRTIIVGKALGLLEIVVFTFIGLVTLSWSTALGVLAWPAFLLVAAYFLLRPLRPSRRRGPGPFAGLRAATTALAHDPLMLTRLGALSFVSFFLEVIALYALTQVFSSTHVLLNVDFPVVMMSLVAAYLASLVRVTPGGFGQFEWGMATAMYIGGVGLPEAVTIPVLYALVRYALFGILALVQRFATDPGAAAERAVRMLAPQEA